MQAITVQKQKLAGRVRNNGQGNLSFTEEIKGGCLEVTPELKLKDEEEFFRWLNTGE